jgi:hypothetical protein
MTMSLKAAIDAELNRLTILGGKGRLEVQAGAGQCSAEILRCDTIGCLVDELIYETPLLANATIDELKALSSALTTRLTYLLEPIGMTEVDADSAAVQLRSSPPHKDDDGTSYYELLIRRGGAISLRRYRARKGQLRERIPAELTRQVLGRLADDFAAAAGG